MTSVVFRISPEFAKSFIKKTSSYVTRLIASTVFVFFVFQRCDGNQLKIVFFLTKISKMIGLINKQKIYSLASTAERGSFITSSEAASVLCLQPKSDSRFFFFFRS